MNWREKSYPKQTGPPSSHTPNPILLALTPPSFATTVNASLNGRSLQENMAWDTGYGRGRLYNGGYGRGGYYGRDYFDAPYYGSSFNYGYGGGYW